MEDSFVDVENVDCHQQSPLGVRPSRPIPSVTPNPARRSMRPRPPVGTYANLRHRSSSPDGSSFKRSNRLDSKPQKRKYNPTPVPGPKLKLKFGERSGVGTSFMGPWDRDLDSDDDDLAFEEQFILRIPEGENCERLRRMVASRNVAEDVWFKFKDSRRAIFHIGESSYNAKLVDLPAIIESQKTLDNRQLFKVADICQMLVVEEPITAADNFDTNRTFDVKDFIWPHGLTPPLRHVRKRRFRKRVNRATIETVEKEVERLLAEDGLAEQTAYSLHSSHSEASDSDYSTNIYDTSTPGFDASSPQPEEDRESATSEKIGQSAADEDDAFDAAFAAEIDQVDLDAGAYTDDESRSSGEGEDDVELFGDEDDETDEDEDEDEETQATRRLLAEEIRDLEAAIEKKIAEIGTVQNILIKRRFEEALRKLRADLDSRLLQRQQMSDLKIAQDQARAQIELDSINVGSSTLQAGEGGEDVAIDDDEEEDAEDEANDEDDVEDLRKDNVGPEVGSEGPSTTAQFVQ